MSKLQVKIDGEWNDLVKIEEVDYKNFEWEKDKTYLKEPLRISAKNSMTSPSTQKSWGVEL